MSVCISGSIVLGTVLALVLALVGPSLSDQGEISAVETVLNLSGIWSIEGLEEVGGVVIALEENGSELYGRAKYEPENGWGCNGQTIGSVAGDGIELVVVSGQDDALVSRKLTGRYDRVNQSIVGEFIQISDVRITRRSQFTAYG